MGEGHPLCRWTYSGVTVDIMPTAEKVIGFSNKWYKSEIAHAQRLKLPGGPEIAILSPPYLMATKIEAFKGRGQNDFLGSADMEDIVALVDGCENLNEEIEQSDIEIKTYLKKEFQIFLKNTRFVEAVQAHIESIEPSGNRAKRTLALIKQISNLQLPQH